MRIRNIDGLSAEDLQQQVKDGGKFVYYPFTISLILVTFKRVSGVYLVRANGNAVKKGMIFTVISFFLGWWGIPFGPKFTIESIQANLRGGKDVTDDVMATVAGHIQFKESQQSKKLYP